MDNKAQIKSASRTYLATIILFIVLNGVLASVLRIIVETKPQLIIMIIGNMVMIFQILLSLVAA